VNPHLATPSGKPRARALGLPFGGTPGPANAITDVPGLELGYVTLVEGDDIRTGVTAIHPRGREAPPDPCAAGAFSLNGNGEMTGWAWVEESGTTSGPITLTHTNAVGTARDAAAAWAAARTPEVADLWLLPVATETWDGFLNDMHSGRVDRAVVFEALDAAASGPVEEGSVGGGTGMVCYSFKGGSGTTSRVVPHGARSFIVGVFLQCNFGSRRELTVAGVPIGAELADDDPLEDWAAALGAGSVVAVVATDAPLLPGQCAALARRVPLGLARTGTTGSHFSGDLFLALSTANPGAFAAGFPGPEPPEPASLSFVPWTGIDPLYEAVVQCVEEAVLNALVANEEMVGRLGHRVPALPRERVRELLRGRLR
jgi:L-aminopeptidase/D-esterase-like protein